MCLPSLRPWRGGRRPFPVLVIGMYSIGCEIPFVLTVWQGIQNSESNQYLVLCVLCDSERPVFIVRPTIVHRSENGRRSVQGVSPTLEFLGSRDLISSDDRQNRKGWTTGNRHGFTRCRNEGRILHQTQIGTECRLLVRSFPHFVWNLGFLFHWRTYTCRRWE